MGTKEKGLIGTTKVLADLVEKGFDVFLPVSEHSPIDIIACRDSKTYRIQVKYRKLSRGNRISITLYSVWSNSKGVNTIPINLNNIDILAIYCKDSNKIYYLDKKYLNNKGCISLSEKSLEKLNRF